EPIGKQLMDHNTVLDVPVPHLWDLPRTKTAPLYTRGDQVLHEAFRDIYLAAIDDLCSIHDPGVLPFELCFSWIGHGYRLFVRQGYSPAVMSTCRRVPRPSD